MTSIEIFKVVLKRHIRGVFMLATIALVLILGLSAHYKHASITEEEIPVRSKVSAEGFESVSINNDLSDRIKQLVKDLEYPDKVAEDFTRMAMDWKDEKRHPVLIRWKVELSNAHQEYQERKITRNQVVKIEGNILQEFFETIRMQFSYDSLAFELFDIIENRQANCVSFSQLMYITWNAVGLSARPIDVLDPLDSPEDGTRKGHIACIVDLFDGQLIMADMTWSYELSFVFKLEEHFVKVGNYWELKDKDNPLQIHKRIRLLDGKGLLAEIYNSRGVVYSSKGEYDRSILEYNKAIENDPGNALAYFNRGVIYYDKGENDRAILDYTKAIEINLKFHEAYYNRGIIYANKGEYDRAILDYTKAIEINPKYTDAYINRGGVYEDKGEYDQAIQDYTKIIEINPEYAGAYYNRGRAYYERDEYVRAIFDFKKAIEIDPNDAFAYLNRAEVYTELGKSEEAKKDLLKALELDPELREPVQKVSEQFGLDLKLD